VSIANLASVLSFPAPSRGDLEQNRSKQTKRDFEKCPLRQKPHYYFNAEHVTGDKFVRAVLISGEFEGSI
jgi:hypothetical protein